jgi:hypothetical protein
MSALSKGTESARERHGSRWRYWYEPKAGVVPVVGRDPTGASEPVCAPRWSCRRRYGTSSVEAIEVRSPDRTSSAGPSPSPPKALLFADPSRIVHPALVNGAAGAVITVDGKPVSVIGFTVVNDRSSRSTRSWTWSGSPRSTSRSSADPPVDQRGAGEGGTQIGAYVRQRVRVARCGRGRSGPGAP